MVLVQEESRLSTNWKVGGLIPGYSQGVSFQVG